MFGNSIMGRKQDCRVGLCGFRKKEVGGAFNLHELATIGGETAGKEAAERGQGNAVGKEALFPVAQEGTQDVFDVVLIDTGKAVQKGTEGVLVVELADDVSLVGSGDLGIRDDDGEEEGMCPAAFLAAEAADTQGDFAVGGFEGARIITVDAEAAGTSAGTCELMELQGGKDVVINILCQGVA